MKSRNRIYLIGLPGTGKSYFGKILAEETGLPFYDLDHIIEEKEGCEITEIFETKGEDYFREVEAGCLSGFNNKEGFILATGGGAPCFHDGIEVMNAHGVTIYLTQERAVLIERLSAKSHRPLLQNNVAEKVDKLLEVRGPIYEQANITIAHREADKVMAEIASKF
ncbi:shikimate kinase [Marinoscillum sp. MHG1-6]|uniref:shikimate kinase n=1 Tax=Marinoscillum sp. MHG1-6 TaxID=2959627 RepID=UPI00215824BE|nr:shikimate kinase [Marinoscillum sp. MHG1-6]